MSEPPPTRLRTILRQKAQYLRGAAADAVAYMRGTYDRELPPVRLRFVGMGDFRAVGESLASLLRDVGGLQSSDHVLDIGCGVGRVAIPLTKTLDPVAATYDGFDIVAAAVRWCSRHITARHPNFNFRHADVFNSFYNRRGVAASKYRFPYDDRSFDFVFATSVFTHLDPEAARHYLEEASRVLRPGGRLLATFFVLGGPKPSIEFNWAGEGYALADPNTPDAAIAFDERHLQSFFSGANWRALRIERGGWSGRSDAPSYQDVVVAVKK